MEDLPLIYANRKLLQLNITENMKLVEILSDIFGATVDDRLELIINLIEETSSKLVVHKMIDKELLLDPNTPEEITTKMVIKLEEGLELLIQQLSAHLSETDIHALLSTHLPDKYKGVPEPEDTSEGLEFGAPAPPSDDNEG
ncbi:hypothetical protein LCGC14_0144890 [marine sediment metagenome]|uniref:Uncharacterized protein n=1 Tax=marine sediment metagenome TaxID=412755 RepID=A0A0F9VF51_9ZZZZ